MEYILFLTVNSGERFQVRTTLGAPFDDSFRAVRMFFRWNGKTHVPLTLLNSDDGKVVADAIISVLILHSVYSRITHVTIDQVVTVDQRISEIDGRISTTETRYFSFGAAPATTSSWE